MKFTELPLKGAYVVEIEAFEDQRGIFERIFCENEFNEIDLSKKIVQINYSQTNRKGAVRGMHFQHPPMAEIKIVKCIKGSVLDVIIDLRRDSDTFLEWHGRILSDENRQMIYIPEGFAHGFQTLDQKCELIYFHTDFYSPDHEGAVRFDDPMIGIKWELNVTEVSKRDKNHQLLSEDFKGILF